MGFLIPNETAVDAAHAGQAEPDQYDFEAIVAGLAGTGVVSGCAVTPQGTPDMTVAVASGVVAVLGVQVAVGAGNVTVTAAHASLNRWDLVVSSNAGVKSVVAGTAAAVPVFPAIPASSVLLAAVCVRAAVTTIVGADLIDKRVTAGGTNSQRVVEIFCDPSGTTLSTGDGKADFIVPLESNGMNLIRAHAALTTASTSGLPTIQLANVTTGFDMLSTKITIDANETTSYTAATPPVIDAARDDVATGDRIRVDCDVAGTGAKGLSVILTFQLP